MPGFAESGRLAAAACLLIAASWQPLSDRIILDIWIASSLDALRAGEPARTLLGRGYVTDLGRTQDVHWAVFWRRSGSVGVEIRYEYNVTTTAPSAPIRGPVSYEVSQVTFACGSRTVWVHNRSLVRPNGTRTYLPGSRRGSYFDGQSIIAQVYVLVC